MSTGLNLFYRKKANESFIILALAQVAGQPGQEAVEEVEFSSMGMDQSGKMKHKDKDMVAEEAMDTMAMAE